MEEEKLEARERRAFTFSIYKLLISIVALIIIIAISVVVGIVMHKRYLEKLEAEKRITSAEVSERLESVSELTTEKIIYQGYIRYEEGDIPFLTKKSYSMTYTAEIEAGIDVSEIEVTEKNDKVYVKIPKSEVQRVYVDPDSIEFYDESYAIFNWESKEDGVDAVSNAEADAKENASIDTLKEEADKHAKDLIEGLLSDAIGDGEVVVE